MPVGIPTLPGLEGHSVVRVSDFLVAYGGRTSPVGLSSRVFCLNLQSNEWRPVECRGYAPLPRCYHTANLYGGRMLVFGGLLAVGVDDVHYNNYNVFFATDLLPPNERESADRKRAPEALHRVTQKPLEPYCFHTLDLIGTATWSSPQTLGDVPEPRSHHSATVSGNNLFVYGGYTVYSNGRVADPKLKSLFQVHSLNLESNVWSRIDVIGSIPPMLWGFGSLLADDILMTFGGVDLLSGEEEAYTCGWHIREGEWRWVIHNDEHALGRRAMLSAVGYEGRAVFFGGSSNIGTRFTNQVHVFDLEKGVWMAPYCTGEVPSPRRGHTATVVGREMLVFGGVDEEGFRSSRCHALDLYTWTWSTRTTTFCEDGVDSLGMIDPGVRHKLRVLHKKRRDALPKGGYDEVKDLVLTRENDSTQWGIAVNDAGKVVGIQPSSPAEAAGMNSTMLVLKVNGSVPKEGTAVAKALAAAEGLKMTLAVGIDESEIPPSPPSSDSEGEEDAGASASPPPPAPPQRGALPSHPLLYTQTPAVPTLSHTAAVLASEPRLITATPIEASAQHQQDFGHNVFLASAANTSPKGLVPPSTLKSDRYSFIDLAGPTHDLPEPPPAPPTAYAPHIQTPQPYHHGSPPRPDPETANKAHWRRQASWMQVNPSPVTAPTEAEPVHPEVDKEGFKRAWKLFGGREVRATTNPTRSRYTSPSIIRLGLQHKLAVNQPHSLQGQFNGPLAASHPYGRSRIRDTLGYGRDTLEELGAQEPGEYVVDAPANFVTTTATAIPEGLGPISAAAFLTGLRHSGVKSSDQQPLDAETIMQRLPPDIRNGASLAYRDKWRNWTWEERLEATKRFAEAQTRQAQIARYPPDSATHPADTLPILPPSKEGAEGWYSPPMAAPLTPPPPETISP